MKLYVSGKFLIPQKNKHIKAWYFFIKYNIEQGDVELQYFPKK